MKASIAHGVRPSALVLGKDSRRRWNRWDFLLAKAYQRFLNELCSQCGLPKYICHTDDNRIQFKPTQDHCASTAVAEKAQAEMQKKDRPSYGVRVFGEPYIVDTPEAEGMEFSDFRRPYLLEEAKRRGLVSEVDE